MYNYKVKFKTNNNQKYLYNTTFRIEASTNEQAKIIGSAKWDEFKNSKERLKGAVIVKAICRKVETKPRQRKMTSLQKALVELNNYIAEDLSK
jgi:hypothetical protein